MGGCMLQPSWLRSSSRTYLVQARYLWGTLPSTTRGSSARSSTSALAAAISLGTGPVQQLAVKGKACNVDYSSIVKQIEAHQKRKTKAKPQPYGATYKRPSILDKGKAFRLTMVARLVTRKDNTRATDHLTGTQPNTWTLGGFP
eukprot:m.93372 g.93372  ORF g.93372 m.93372 type:complete len:144 (-) comp14983_c0_seq17:318-749(-)